MDPYNKPYDIDSYLYEISILKYRLKTFYFIFDYFKIWKNVNSIGQNPGKHQIFITINRTESKQLELCPIYVIPTTVGDILQYGV